MKRSLDEDSRVDERRKARKSVDHDVVTVCLGGRANPDRYGSEKLSRRGKRSVVVIHDDKLLGVIANLGRDRTVELFIGSSFVRAGRRGPLGE